MPEHDLIIRNGRIVDGAGGDAFDGDIAIAGGRIRSVGKVEGDAEVEFDAAGALVTPGFVDIHTHYDGQVTWASRLLPSTNHGVTTVVTGNCGVGFAPCRPADRDRLIKVMEGVEDIPEVVMADGLPWRWESFPEYMAFLADRRFDADVAVHIPHSPLRVFVMGDRAAKCEASTGEDRQVMADLVAEGVRAGALGVSTSHSLTHRLLDGGLAPSVISSNEELIALARGLRWAGGGVFQIITEATAPVDAEMGLVERLARESGRPVSFSLIQTVRRPDDWREILARLGKMNAEGLEVRAQVSCRPVGLLFGLELSAHPFMARPSYRAIAGKPLAERVRMMRDPALKERILSETSADDVHPVMAALMKLCAEMFLLGNDPDYAPSRENKLGARARREGIDPEALAYDLLLEDDGHAILGLPSANFVSGDLSVVREMMTNSHTVVALGDGGAHLGLLCDAGYPSYMLAHWARDAEDRFPLPWIIAALTSRPAEAVGLRDRGLLKPGLKADINIIDHERVRLAPPRPVFDLPAGGRRLHQTAEGYRATIVSGEFTWKDGEPTSELPGRLVRGAAARI